MKIINVSVFLGVLLALPVIYFLDNDPVQPLGYGAIALIVFLTVGIVHTLNSLRGKNGVKNVEK